MRFSVQWPMLIAVCGTLFGGVGTYADEVEPGSKGIAIEKTTDVRAFVIILDCSGSMKDAIEGEETKFAAAQRATIELFKSVPEGRQLAVVVYGHDIQLECQAATTIRQLTPIDAEGKAELEKAILALEPLGSTPIALSLKLASDQLTSTQEMAKVLLISDGMETCKGNPVEEAGLMAEKFPNLIGGVDVIGFGLQGDDGEALEKIAAAGKGKYYDAKSTKELTASVAEVRRDVVVEAEAPPVDLSPIEKALIAKLSDPDRDVRVQAADALKKRKTVAAVPNLIQVLLNNEWDNFAGETLSRDAAYDAIKELAPERLEKAVLEASESKNESVRAWATKKLGE